MTMTGSQTVGPFLHIGLAGLYRDRMTDHDDVIIAGRVLDGNGAPVPDGMLEIWQADGQGIYPDPKDERAEAVTPGFRGFCRVATDAEGRFRFSTIMPGRVPGDDGALQAPHIMVSVFMRGLIKRLATRIYFPDGDGNEIDPVLRLVPPQRRATLIARAVEGQPGLFEWDVIIQAGPHGRAETVFLDV